MDLDGQPLRINQALIFGPSYDGVRMRVVAVSPWIANLKSEIS